MAIIIMTQRVFSQSPMSKRGCDESLGGAAIDLSFTFCVLQLQGITFIVKARPCLLSRRHVARRDHCICIYLY